MTTTGLKKVLMASALVVTGFAIASPAVASDRRGDRGAAFAERMMDRFDTDGDGSVTLEEFRAGEDRFADADEDGDGYLTEEEIIARASDPKGRRIDRIIGRVDSDGDGNISLQEAKDAAVAQAERRFARADDDGDGFITEAEARSMLEQRGERRMARRGHHGERSGYRRHRRGHGHGYDDHAGRGDGSRHGYGRGGRHALEGEERAEAADGDRATRREARRQQRMERHAKRAAARLLVILDTDGDDRVSRAEADARLATHFAQMDANNDGKVTSDELESRAWRFRHGRRSF